jgi:hypothetical protein
MLFCSVGFKVASTYIYVPTESKCYLGIFYIRRSERGRDCDAIDTFDTIVPFRRKKVCVNRVCPIGKELERNLMKNVRALRTTKSTSCYC